MLLCQSALVQFQTRLSNSQHFTKHLELIPSQLPWAMLGCLVNHPFCTHSGWSQHHIKIIWSCLIQIIKVTSPGLASTEKPIRNNQDVNYQDVNYQCHKCLPEVLLLPTKINISQSSLTQLPQQTWLSSEGEGYHSDPKVISEWREGVVMDIIAKKLQLSSISSDASSDMPGGSLDIFPFGGSRVIFFTSYPSLILVRNHVLLCPLFKSFKVPHFCNISSK